MVRKILSWANSHLSSSLYKATADESTTKLLWDNYNQKSRDNARTPMQWDSGPQAGFTTGSTPWMRVNDNYKEINAASQASDPKSVYHCWRQVLEKRKQNKDIFVYGDFVLVDEPNEKVFAYKRTAANGEAAIVASNFTAETVDWKFDGKPRGVLVSPGGKTLEDLAQGTVTLGPCEAIAFLI